MAKVDNYYKHYVPSVPAAIAAGLIFAVLTTGHVALMMKSKPRRKFTIAFVIGGLCKFAVNPQQQESLLTFPEVKSSASSLERHLIIMSTA
jgi:hypothetical protein